MNSEKSNSQGSNDEDESEGDEGTKAIKTLTTDP